MIKKFIDAYQYCKEHKRWTVVTLTVTSFAAAIGAYAGALAYYNGWLG